MVAHLHSRRLEGSDYELTVRLTWCGSSAIAIEHNSLHQSGSEFLAGKFVVVSLIRCAVEIVGKSAKPARHVRPGKENGNRHHLGRRILCMPAIDGDGIAGLAIVVGQHGRELFEYNVSGKLIPLVVVPGFWIQS